MLTKVISFYSSGSNKSVERRVSHLGTHLFALIEDGDSQVYILIIIIYPNFYSFLQLIRHLENTGIDPCSSEQNTFHLHHTFTSYSNDLNVFYEALSILKLLLFL